MRILGVFAVLRAPFANGASELRNYTGLIQKPAEYRGLGATHVVAKNSCGTAESSVRVNVLNF